MLVFYAVSHDGYIRAKKHPEQQSEIQNRMIQHTAKQLETFHEPPLILWGTLERETKISCRLY